MASIQPLVVVGVDPHADTLVATGTDTAGVTLFHCEAPNTAEGIRQLIGQVNGAPVKWAIEGTGTYGRALCDELLAGGFNVVEVPTRLTARHRSKAGNNKTDKGDAAAIARAALADDCAQVSHHPVCEALRILVTQRQSLVRAQVETVNRIRARRRELNQDTALPSGRLRSRAAFVAFVEIDIADDTNPHTAALGHVIALEASNWLVRNDQIRQLEVSITEILPESGKALMGHAGIGLIGAATIVAFTGDIGRFPTDGHYASYCGTAPLDASSGRQQRHRLNRWGNRTINKVFHIAIITQLSQHGEAHAYVTKRITENKTKKEAIRAAKRKLNRRVYRTLKQHKLT